MGDMLDDAIDDFDSGLGRLRSDASTPQAGGAEPMTPRLPEDERESDATREGERDATPGAGDPLRSSIVLNSEFGYSADPGAGSSPYTDDKSAWGFFTVESVDSMPEPEPEAALTAQLSSARPSRVIYLNADTQQEHTTTAEKLVGELLRAGAVGEATVVWVPDYEQHLLGDAIDLEAAREASELEVDEIVQMLAGQLHRLPRSATRSFPSHSDAASKPLSPFSVTIHEPGPLGIQWTSRTNASPPEIERVAPGSIASREPQLQRGMVLLTVQGKSLHGLSLSLMLAAVDDHAARPLILGFAEPASGVSDEEVYRLAAGDALASTYGNLRSRSSHEVEIFRAAARELRLEQHRDAAVLGGGDARRSAAMTMQPYEATLTTAKKIRGGGFKPGTKLIVKADYTPSFDGAIPVKKDQEVIAVDTRHAEWWAVDAGSARGHVPKSFLEPLRKYKQCAVDCDYGSDF